MHRTYQYEIFEYKPSPEQRLGKMARYPVIVVGAGPVGLTAAIDLANCGVKVVLLDEGNQVSEGSRAICFAKRSLEVFDRLGAVGPMRVKGVTWDVGRLFYRDQEVYSFDLLPEEGHAHPAFINLQQYYVEQYLIDHLKTLPCAEMRWLNRVVGLEANDDCVRLSVQTPDGHYSIEGDYVVAADGAHSSIRQRMQLDWEGIAFEDKFLIADVVMKADFPSERWFWFDPPFNPGQSALLHHQPDNVWRTDFQLGRDVDAEAAKQPENVIPHLRAMLGPKVPFELEWVSVYSFQSRMLDDFHHGRVLFAGDAAHLMSPFGARGANSGIQDADNLVWKLKLVLDGKAPSALLDSYSAERVYAARENLAYTESSVEFMSPGNTALKALRNAVLELSQAYPFARPLINSGRLSTATLLCESPLNTPDEDPFEGPMSPGTAGADAPVLRGHEPAWFLKQLGGTFNGILFAEAVAALPSEVWVQLKDLAQGAIPIKTVIVTTQDYPEAALAGFPVLVDAEGFLHRRYDGGDGTFYLTRPDQHVCARWRRFDQGKVKAALAKACCH